MSAAGHGGAIENLGVFGTFRNQETGQPALQACQGMVNQDISAGDFKSELDHRRATWGNRRRLDVRQGRGGQGCLVIDPVKDLADDMERGGKVWSAHAEENAHGLTDIGLERLLLGQSPPRRR